MYSLLKYWLCWSGGGEQGQTLHGGIVLEGADGASEHTSIMSHSPSHFIVRVSLAKRPRPMLQDSLHFFRSDIIFSLLPGLSLPKKGATSEKKSPP